MTLRKTIISGHAILLALVLSNNAMAERKSIKVQVAPGGEVLCSHHTNFTMNCEPLPVPTVKIIRPPANGTAEVRSGTFVVNKPWHPDVVNSCIGKSFPGRGIYYRANQTFRGVDTLVYEAKIGEGKGRIVTFEVEVQVTVQ